MIPRILFLGLMLMPGLALAADSLPRYDPARSCAEAARRSGARNNQASPDCLRSEADARNDVARIWPGLSAAARSRCTRLADRRQSYLILSSCAEREAALQR